MQAACASNPPVEGISVSGLEKRYRSGFLLRPKCVVREVSAVLERGASAALIGPNGSGKSTLLRMLAGSEAPSSGSLRVLGGDPRAAAVRGRIGHLPEGTPFPLELSVRANLVLAAGLRGFRRRAAKRAAEAWLERVGLGADARKPLGKLSSGQRRRFGLAQACLHEPEVLLLDEPSAGLDAAGIVLLEELCNEASSRGATLVICSHRPDDLFERAARVWVMVGGRLALDAGAADVVAAHPGLRSDARQLDALYTSLGSN